MPKNVKRADILPVLFKILKVSHLIKKNIQTVHIKNKIDLK